MKKQSTTTKRTLQLFWHHAWQHKRYVIALCILMPLANFVFRFLPPLLIAEILERLSNGDYVQGDVWKSFGPQLVTYATFIVLGGIVLWRLVIIALWKLEMRVTQDLHQRIFAHLMSMSADFHSNRFGGSLVSQANKLVGAYIRLADTTIFQVGGLLLSFIFTIVILAPKAPVIVLLLLLFSIIFMIASVRITKYVRHLNAIEASASNRQTGFLADAVTNVLAVKSFAHSTYENMRFAGATEKSRQATNDVMRASVLRDFFFSGATSTISIVSLVLAVIGVVVFNAEVATVYLIVTYAGIITENLWQFSQNTLRNYNRALGEARDMIEILNIKPSILDPDEPEPVKIQRGAIRFENVSFSYSDNSQELLFHKLNLSIKSGEKVGLVGHSGGGKTTVTKLLLRFMDIQDGKILIDGQNIAHVTQDDLRAYIAYVPQEPLLFHRTLRENIRYGRPEATEKEIIAISKMANAHEFISLLPESYKTLVGERGVKLSGGQRQRVAIARAMLKNAPILVLDEATSALDSESEALIQDALWKLMEGRTAIVIAHRLSTIQKMDRIVVLGEGKIVEQGSHRELLRNNGVYADLWHRQSGGFLEE